MEIEKLAVGAVISSLSKTDVLSSFINSGDKEPCWDGNIYIHESKKRTKKNIKKVATQVKGKLVKCRTVNETIAYRVSFDDLNAYMMNGGTMFFVVYLDGDSGELIQIYYASLLPFTIKSILKETKDTYKVEFKRFPDDKFHKTELLLNFYNNAQKQASFAGKDLPSIEELSKQGLLESLSFGYTSIGRDFSQNNLPKLIDGKSITLYANIKGGDAPIPVEHYENIHQVTMSSGRETPVSVGGVKFYDEVNIITTAQEHQMKIGSCMKLVFPNVTDPKTEIPLNIETKVQGTLNERILGVEYILAILKQGSFSIGETEFPYILADANSKEDKIKELEVLLSQLGHIKSVLNYMSVNKDLDAQKCTKDDLENINLIVRAIGEGQPVEDCPGDKNEVHKITIANINLAVIYLKNENEKYRIYDYFKNRFATTWKPLNEAPIRISQFATMSADDFLIYDNLVLQAIIDDYKDLELNSYVVESANRLLLEMLKAYDKKTSQELLNAAKQMSDWLTLQTNYISTDVTTINALQIVLRERQLNFDEKSKLYHIISTTTEPLFKLGAFILLDEQDEAKKIIETTDDEQVKALKEFPIYRFYKYDSNKNKDSE